MKKIFLFLILIMKFPLFSQEVWDQDCYIDTPTMLANMAIIKNLRNYLEKNTPDSIIMLLDKNYLIKDADIKNKLKESSLLISKNYKKFSLTNPNLMIANEKQHYIKLNYFDKKSNFFVYSVVSYFNHKDKNSKIVDIKFEDHFSEFQKILDEEDHEEPPPFQE
ncbi:MAG: hypothetical protein V4549_16685 [Bacteroidota bacterium]